MDKKDKKEGLKKSKHKLIADFITQGKHYKAGIDSISVTEKGAEYLRKIKKIK